MSAGTYTDRFITCDHEACGWALFGSQLGLKDGHTLAAVRRAASKNRGWQTAAQRPAQDSYPWAAGLLDFCPSHRLDKKADA